MRHSVTQSRGERGVLREEGVKWISQYPQGQMNCIFISNVCNTFHLSSSYFPAQFWQTGHPQTLNPKVTTLCIKVIENNLEIKYLLCLWVLVFHVNLLSMIVPRYLESSTISMSFPCTVTITISLFLKYHNRMRTYYEGNSRCLYISFRRVVSASSTPHFCLYANLVCVCPFEQLFGFWLFGSAQSAPDSSLRR